MISVVTIAEPVTAWLREEPCSLQVHSAFPQAINLVSADGRFLALLAKDAGNGPFALRLACQRLPNVPVGTPVRVDGRTLVVGPLTVDWRSARLWDPTLRPLNRPARHLDLAPDALRESSSIFAHAFTLLLDREGAGQATFSVAQRSQARSLLAGLAAGLGGDDTTLSATVHGLVGFGAGLTPAGDDCLLGVLAARRMLGELAGTLESAIRECTPRTTSLSAAFLRAACDGYFAGHWHWLRNGLESQDEESIERAVCGILEHGATSGADALAGWLVGLMPCQMRPEG